MANFRVFKKSSPNSKVTLYMGKRDFVDNISFVEPVDGVVVLSDDYIRDRKVFGQVICSFRYGREEDEVMGLNFQKELILTSQQINPISEKHDTTKMQERLLKKLGPNAVPFTLQIPTGAPASITLQPAPGDTGAPCGVHYYVKIFAGESDTDRAHRRNTVTLNIRKVQFAPSKKGQQPCTVVRKDFMLSPGELELEVSLDKQLYHHGEKIVVSICIRNNTNKVVKKIKASVQQGVDVVLFQNGMYRTPVASMETQEGCPIQPGSSLQKIIYLQPTLESNKERRGIALDGQLKKQDTNLASTTLLNSLEDRDAFGIIVSYTVKVKLFMGALAGELVAELPFTLMHPQPQKNKFIRADSQAEVELFRQDTIDQDGKDPM
ncbi:LOW QUALITY PROTEIN: arrestin homolog [Ctenocephalides felis]|uniref:LOW QUALITY PROTEIN: arrestin homolog n=1 Tax=Ctenocephalides felis TaxID=7515 RepID=UPI000E6E5879|nr:LOW QUALITY PROTEIN: arrestin homolog [Ctenocephalides felis]